MGKQLIIGPGQVRRRKPAGFLKGKSGDFLLLCPTSAAALNTCGNRGRDHDTVIHGQTWKVLKLLSYDDNNNLDKASNLYCIIRQDSFIVRQWMDSFATVLYNFRQNLTDTIIYQTSIKKPEAGWTKICLDSLDTIIISSQKRVIFHCGIIYPTNPLNQRPWTIIESIGAMEGFMPIWSGIGATHINNIRCYNDSAISYSVPKPLGWVYKWNCDSAIELTGITPDKPEQGHENWSVAPNPFINTLRLNYKGLENSPDNILVQIYTPTGQIVYTKTLINPSISEELDLASIAQGLYFLKIQSSNSQSVLKILKN